MREGHKMSQNLTLLAVRAGACVRASGMFWHVRQGVGKVFNSVQRKDGGKMKKFLVVVALLAMAALAVVALPGCGALTDRERAAAARLEAEAGLARAEAQRERVAAEAVAEKMRAEVAAAAERSAVRQVERDAALERALVLLPVLALTFGVVLAGVAAVVALTRRGGSVAGSDVVLLLERQERRLAELERAQWHSIAESQRRRLPVADADKVLVVDILEEERW